MACATMKVFSVCPFSLGGHSSVAKWACPLGSQSALTSEGAGWWQHGAFGLSRQENILLYSVMPVESIGNLGYTTSSCYTEVH